MTEKQYVLGVDGGGSSTIVWLADDDPTSVVQPLGVGTSGPSNLQVLGFEVASQNLSAAIDEAFEMARVSPTVVRSLCLSMAGSDRIAEQQRWTCWVTENRISQWVTITNDAVSVLFAVHPMGCGVALIAGTGSLAVARNRLGETVRSGGWGPLIGDEGSGYILATSGLQAAVQAADGRGEATEMLDGFLASLEITRASQIIPVLHSDTYDRPKIAALAKVVFQAAGNGDTVAKQVIDHQARELTFMVRAVLKESEQSAAELALGITGGVLLNQPDFVSNIVNQLAANGIEFQEVLRVEHPVAGAVQLARLHDTEDG